LHGCFAFLFSVFVKLNKNGIFICLRLLYRVFPCLCQCLKVVRIPWLEAFTSISKAYDCNICF
jgi:hypothetical protein